MVARTFAQLLSNGDMTEIGERGVTLSGGQRQRVGWVTKIEARELLIFLLVDNPIN